MLFCVCLLLLNLVLVRFVHVVACGCGFVLIAAENPFMWMCHCSSIQPLTVVCIMTRFLLQQMVPRGTSQEMHVGGCVRAFLVGRISESEVMRTVSSINTAKQMAVVVVPVLLLTSEWEFWLLHVLANTYYFLCFSLKLC